MEMVMVNNFIIKDKYSFKLYPFFKEDIILNALQSEIEYYGLPKEINNVLEDAWNSRFWESSGYDGATFIKNRKHPSIANFIHDYLYRCGFGGKIADEIYRLLLLQTGYSKLTANYRYSGIRIFGSYFRLRNYLKGNFKQKNYNMMSLYYILKQNNY